MKTTKSATKKFEAVKMMRKIRNKIDKDIKGMTFEEEKEYFKKRAEKFKRQLKDDK